jgi:hypothetical protein
VHPSKGWPLGRSRRRPSRSRMPPERHCWSSVASSTTWPWFASCRTTRKSLRWWPRWQPGSRPLVRNWDRRPRGARAGAVVADSQEPQLGPSGSEFATRYRHQTGREPSYPAAQAAAAGYLAQEAHRVGMTADDVVNWASSTLLGDFALDSAWRQSGDGVTTVRWLGGRMVPLSAS